MNVSTNPSDTLMLVRTFECSKKAVCYQTFIADPEVSFIVKTEELTKDLQNFLAELERKNMKKKEEIRNDCSKRYGNAKVLPLGLSFVQ